MTATEESLPKTGLAGMISRNYFPLKMAFLLFLVLLLFIALEVIGGVISERTWRRDSVVADISRTWGQAQTLAGPLLVIPYRYYIERQEGDERELLERKADAFFLPDRLQVSATLEPEIRYRGIFEAILYTTAVEVAGSFATPNFDRLKIAPEDVFWDEAILAFGVTDLRGAAGAPALNWAGTEIPFEPGTTNEVLKSGVHVPLAIAGPSLGGSEEHPFSLAIKFTGNRAISFSPTAKATSVALTSPWPHPSFHGAYLPSERKVADSGFSARWEVSYLGRDYPQFWTSRSSGAADMESRLSASQFGVSLISPVDFYLMSERSIKHGLLLIVLIFAAIFIFEIVAALKVHFFQYSLVGGALCLFYLLLLSLSEILGFGPAYGLAATLSTGLIALYMGHVLSGWRRAGSIALILGGVYGYLFVILQLEAYALLAGSLGLFLALAAVMYTTRKIDWYAIRRP
jgi:inner membrane protein